MTSVIREPNLLPIPDQIARELGLQSGSSVEVTRTLDGFEVRIARPGMRQGADGVWRTHADRIAILEGLQGRGKLLLPAENQVEALLKDREEDVVLDDEDKII
jgi:hypothetical protein